MTIEFFIDVESTGLINRHIDLHHESQPRVAQVGYIVAEDGKIVEQASHLVKPHGWYDMPDSAEEIHHISHDSCVRHGYHPVFVFNKIADLIEKADTVIAHNYSYDSQMIFRELRILDPEYHWDQSKPYVCTMQEMIDICQLPSANAKYKDHKWPKLIEAYRHCFGEDFEGEHDALYDIQACFKIYRWLVENGHLNQEAAA